MNMGRKQTIWFKFLASTTSLQNTEARPIIIVLFKIFNKLLLRLVSVTSLLHAPPFDMVIFKINPAQRQINLQTNRHQRWTGKAKHEASSRFVDRRTNSIKKSIGMPSQMAITQMIYP